MLERIREILTKRHLTPTQFADAIGVGRPIISHILSGRNKPSLEVVQKIIAAFPDLSLPWLLSGAGEMVAAPGGVNAATTTEQPENSALAASPARKTAPARSDKPRVPAKPLQASNDVVDALEYSETVTSSSASVAPVSAPIAEVVPTMAPPALPSEPAPSASKVSAVLPPVVAPSVTSDATAATLAGLTSPEKAIRRIVIFYQDGTFVDYRPEAAN
ncbi:helix-turn-helix domain-containing protein [Hymenobacter jejuensis]|uniref:Helix-turn-helix transcriptional regulator n=1 Tax=Hymenobacter jejuensis TaxID=2502781 RepID=A0A5B8A3S6_9BACT|nr:helix-turn-helix transcriptional regulator [Hymenobacter jejuensis]QDA61789.1 helix-turn-helix transcriptional regulator [Hymenobacter jejuensis]